MQMKLKDEKQKKKTDVGMLLFIVRNAIVIKYHSIIMKN